MSFTLTLVKVQLSKTSNMRVCYHYKCEQFLSQAFESFY